MKKIYYFDDIEVGSTTRYGSYELSKEEIIEFAKRWDPQPFHIDEEKARNSVFGGLTGSAAHTFAINTFLSKDNPEPWALSAGLGVKEMHLPTPTRPGDVLSLQRTVLEKRPSSSRPDQGIVTIKLLTLNQRDEVIMEQIGKMLIRRKVEN